VVTNRAVNRVVAILGVGLVDPAAPVIRADDLGLIRGDGIFEMVHVRGGQAWLLDEHLARMARSATHLGLALPGRAELLALAAQVLAAWPDDVEGALRLICTWGSEDSPGAPVTVFATVTPVGAAPLRARDEGLAVLTASLERPALGRSASPWLLAGAKTVSYAVNMAAQRWAQAAGADDVLWTSTDGYVLEAPTSSVIWRRGTMLSTVPAERTGILAGITARWLLDHADQLGWNAAEQMITPVDLIAADGAWLTSSIRGIAAIRTLDGTTLATSPDETKRLRRLLGF
jgi:4-amino-4-deoxychorismate lyase